MKIFFQGFYESLRIEKLGKNIYLTVLCPGPILGGRRKQFTENSCKVNSEFPFKIFF